MIVGIASTVVNYGLFLALFKAIGVNYVISSVSGYIVGLFFGYVLNRGWTFSSVTENRKKEFLLYLGIYTFSLVLSVVVLRMAVEVLSVNPLISNILAIGASTVSNFFGLKFLVFNKRAAGLIGMVAVYFTPAFWIIFAVKAASSFLFGSHFATDGFIPFLNYFAETLGNPYEYFSGAATIPFPYPGGMLLIFGIPFVAIKSLLPFGAVLSESVYLFLLRLPILVADVLVYLILCFLLPTKEKKVLWLYFASPVLFYISYFHGQLDVVPTALLLLSVLLFFREKKVAAFLLLGLGIAAKTHLLAALPFYLVYAYRKGAGFPRLALFFGLALLPFFVLNPYLLSQGFLGAVFNNPEQARLFSISIPFGFKDLRFFIAPAAILLIFFRFASYRKVNKDFFLLALALVYTTLIALVPPMQGWFYWSLPLLIFFFIQFRGAPFLALGAAQGFYLLYFFFTSGSDVFQSISPLIPAFAGFPTPFSVLEEVSAGLGSRAENILFTALEASLLMSVFWAYRVASSSNIFYQGAAKPFVVGVGGDSGVGKTKLAGALARLVGERNMVRLCGDDVHKWERGHENWKVITHLNPKGSHVHLDLEQARSFLRGESVERPSYDHATGKFGAKTTLEPKRFVVFEGLMPFLLERMRRLFDLKIYIEADEESRIGWKLARDSKERGHTRESIEGQIASRKPDAERFIHPQREFADFIIRYSKSGEALKMECWIRNSFFVEHVVDSLTKVSALSVSHEYVDLHFQEVSFTGQISKEKILEIAYQIFPNASDLVDNYPDFEDDFDGVLQLLYLAVLSSHYKLEHDEEIF